MKGKIMGNNWKMRCVSNNGTCNANVYTEGKIYDVVNREFYDDKEYLISYRRLSAMKSFKLWNKYSASTWELVEDKNMIKEKIAKAEGKIAKWKETLDALKHQEKPLTEWGLPKFNHNYWIISNDGTIRMDVKLLNDYLQDRYVLNLNAFSTREKAQEIANEQLAYRMARKFADEWDERRDKGRLWCVFYDKEDKLLRYDSTCSFPSTAFLFPSEDCVSEFINQHGKEYAKLLGWELN